MIFSVLLLIGGITGLEGSSTNESEVMTNCPTNTLNVPDLPNSVSRHVGGLYLGRVIICGGYSFPERQSNCYKWNLGQSQWTYSTPMNVVRDLAASAVVPDVGFLVIGGKDGEGNSLKTTEVFNRDGWNFESDTPGSVYHH